MLIVRNILVLLVLFTVSPASADLVYLKGQLGMSVATDGTIDGTDIDTDVAAPYPITLGVGVHFSPMHSLALDLNYETMDINDLPPSVTAIGTDEQTQVSAMLNYYFHFPKILLVRPFIGVGAGYTMLTIKKNDFEGDGFTWQAIVGTDVVLNDFLSIVSEFRLFKPTEFSLTDNNDVEVGDFNTTQVKFLVGLKLSI